MWERDMLAMASHECSPYLDEGNWNIKRGEDHLYLECIF